MAADDVVVEPGDMLLLHTGFATKVLEWNREPDPVKSRPEAELIVEFDWFMLSGSVFRTIVGPGPAGPCGPCAPWRPCGP